MRPEQVIISLAPGITIRSLKDRLGHDKRFARAMPNTPAMLGAGMTGLAWEKGSLTPKEEQELKAIFEVCGKVAVVEERLMNAVGCVSGSSPAFIYMMIEALSDGGVKYGLPRSIACEVCSPGGTTIQGVSALEEMGFRSALIKACDACYEKSTQIK